MRKLYTITALGHEPVPWSAPYFGRKARKDGSSYQFSTRKKSDVAHGRLNFHDWKDFVAQAARKVVAGGDPVNEPVHIHFDFFAETPPGRRHGELWDVKIRWNKKLNKGKGGYSKETRGGRQEPDLTNLVKSTEDALEGIVFGNDVVCRFHSACAFFGPLPGVRIHVSLIEPDDYPGRGDPV